MNSQLLLRSLISSTIIKNLRKNIHTTSGYKAPEVYQRDKKGSTYNKIYADKKSPEEEFWEEKSFTEKIKGEFQLFKKECKLFKQEFMSQFHDSPILDYRKGEVDVVWRFSENQECLNKWIVTADSDNSEGYSTANLELSPHGSGIFSGNLDMRVPQDGEVTSAGYCNIRTVVPMKSFGRETTLNWSIYTHLRMRIRGDGRFYMINIGLKQTFDLQWFEMHNYILMTRGGPYWQDIKIPFSKFFLTHKGRVQDRQRPLEQDRVSNIGITCADKVPGPFRLEIDYIGLEFDNSSFEEFAYESYDIDTLKL